MGCVASPVKSTNVKRVVHKVSSSLTFDAPRTLSAYGVLAFHASILMAVVLLHDSRVHDSRVHDSVVQFVPFVLTLVTSVPTVKKCCLFLLVLR